jgi:hypothetical protein
MQTVYPPITVHFLHPSRTFWISFNVPANTEVYAFLYYLISQNLVAPWQYGYWLKYKGHYLTQEMSFYQLGVLSGDAFEIEPVAPPLPNQPQAPQPTAPTFSGKGFEQYLNELVAELIRLNNSYKGQINPVK